MFGENTQDSRDNRGVRRHRCFARTLANYSFQRNRQPTPTSFRGWGATGPTSRKSSDDLQGGVQVLVIRRGPSNVAQTSHCRILFRRQKWTARDAETRIPLRPLVRRIGPGCFLCPASLQPSDRQSPGRHARIETDSGWPFPTGFPEAYPRICRPASRRPRKFFKKVLHRRGHWIISSLRFSSQ